MISLRPTAVFAVTVILAVGWTAFSADAVTPMDVNVIEQAAHGSYLAAINSNDLETVMADLTTEVVYQSPNETEVVGKEAVRKWASDYIQAYRFHWDKTSIGFTVSGDWAFERYAYKVTNTDKKSGAISTDEGKGVNVYHRDKDGKWRVAIDTWNSDLPLPKPSQGSMSRLARKGLEPVLRAVSKPARPGSCVSAHIAPCGEATRS